MDLFEILMLVCFGVSWPFSIYRSWKSGQIAGKSLVFLYLVCIGYASGFTHKILHSFDGVTWLYLLNGLMVLTDITLYHRNQWRLRRTSSSAQS